MVKRVLFELRLLPRLQATRDGRRLSRWVPEADNLQRPVDAGVRSQGRGGGRADADTGTGVGRQSVLQNTGGALLFG